MLPKRAGRFAALARLLPPFGREELLPNETRTLCPPYSSYGEGCKRAEGTISERFPQASFVVEEGFDPKGFTS